MAGGMLKVTLKARGDAGEAAAPAKRAKSWHEPGWAEQFKGLAPPPPRPVARARVPAGSYVPEKTRPTSKTAASELEWETYSEEERARIGGPRARIGRLGRQRREVRMEWMLLVL